MLPFSLPAPNGKSTRPIWNGRTFLIDGESSPVLEYSENFEGWSDDLTLLHEESAGDSHPIDIASRENALRRIQEFLPREDAVIVEIGCSSGFFIKDMVKFLPRATIIGVDVVRKPLFNLAEQGLGIPLMRFDLLQCPMPEGTVDVLVMLNVLEHIRDDVLALERAFSLLKPGGILIIEVPAGEHLYDGYDAELHHFRRYSALQLSKKLVAEGFYERRLSHIGFLLYPAFVVVKLFNKYLRRDKQSKIVRDQANKTSASNLLKLIMRFESSFLSRFRLPFGIRVVAVAKKPKI